jgi:bifunctional DNA-binding transcriptional regulator/antitoxin component of YhaV-PrlF toxin-antitoxin module
MKRSTFVGVRGRGEIVLPAEVRRRHRLDTPGAQVEVVEREDGVIELHPHLPVPADQAWFWESAWQEGERLVDEHVASGRVLVSGDIDQFLGDIEKARLPRRPPRSPKRRTSPGG